MYCRLISALFVSLSLSIFRMNEASSVLAPVQGSGQELGVIDDTAAISIHVLPRQAQTLLVAF